MLPQWYYTPAERQWRPHLMVEELFGLAEMEPDVVHMCRLSC